MSVRIPARVLTPGAASGRVCRLDEPLSFWGGYDPATGSIIDVHHPQSGRCLAGWIVVMPSARGSAGTPACIAEAIRLGVAPAGFILGAADINVSAGALVARKLYDVDCPVVCVRQDDYDTLSAAAVIDIAADGTITTRELQDGQETL